MLVVSKESKERLRLVRNAMEADLRMDAMKGFRPTKMNGAAETLRNRIDCVWKRFEEKLVYLALYGEDPRLWRVYLTLSTRARDWGYHGVTFWRYKSTAPLSPEGMPLDHYGFEHFMTGALVCSTSDDTWNVHT